MNRQKQLFFFIKILVITATYTYYASLHSSEQHNKVHHWTTSDVVSFPPTTVYGAIVQNTLMSTGDDDTIFICYAGHENIKTWIRKSYIECKRICDGPTNTFTEIDINSGIEWSLKPIEETNNAQPVNAIARHNDLYLIAHENNVYTCNKKMGALKDILKKKYHFMYQLHESAADDANKKNVIAKLFTNNHNQIIAISDKGAIFYHAIDENAQPVAPVYDLQTTQTDIIYDKHNNILLLGEGKNLCIVDFRSESPRIHSMQLAPHCHFNIKAIDTSDSHILISDIKPKHYFDVSKNREHKKVVDCCKKNAIPYAQRPDCANCTQELFDYHNNTIDIAGTPDEIAKRLQEQKPAPCTHKQVPNLPTSCAQQTMLLYTWNDVIEFCKNQQQESCPANIYTFEDYTRGCYDGHKVIMHTLLTNNQTVLIHSKSGNDGHSGFSSDIDECKISGLPSELSKITDFHGSGGLSRDIKIHWLKSDKETLLVYTNFFHWTHGEMLPKRVTSFSLCAPQKNKQPLSYYLKTWPKYAFFWSIEHFYKFIYLTIEMFVLYPMNGILGAILNKSSHKKIMRTAQKNNPATPLCFCYVAALCFYCLHKCIA